MRKSVLKTASIFACTAFFFASLADAALSLAQTKNVFSETASASETEETNGFSPWVAPDLYEEYLSLSSPSDVAVTEYYTAIADGNTIYLYDRAKNEYRKYEHDLNDYEPNGSTVSDPTKSYVKKLQFDDVGNLYFLGSLMDLYKLDPVSDFASAKAERILDFSCKTFLIKGNDLYFTTASGGVSTLLKTELSNPRLATAKTLVENLYAEPALAFWDGELYYTNSGVYLHKIDPSAPSAPDAEQTLAGTFSSNIFSIGVNGGIFTCSTLSGDFYAYAMPHPTQETLLTHEESGFSSLAAFGEYVYAIQGAAVRRYSVTERAFCETYEISADSSAVNRLRGATDVYLAGNKLFISDVGNGRISVYDTEKQTFGTPLRTTLPVSLLVGDGETLLGASMHSAEIYSVCGENYGERTATFERFHGNIVGAASVYGKYYLVTDENYFYLLAQNGEGVWELTETEKRSSRRPTHLTADVYGTLYIAHGGRVYDFDEWEFTDPENDGGEDLDVTLPADTAKIAVDYGQNVYALAENSVYRLEKSGAGENAEFDFSRPQAYAESVNVCAFTFGAEENATYLLCDGNYVIRSQELTLPTMKSIAVEGADEEIFSENSAEFTVVKTRKNALTVKFDVEKLSGAQAFPYLSFTRREEELTALKIGEAGNYSLLAVFDENAHEYETYLVLSRFCEPLPAEEYRTQYAESERVSGYLTNALPLYKFPYLTPLLVAENSLPRGGKVTLLGEIAELDHDYYHVLYVDGDGAEKTGYVPKAYVTLFDGIPPESQEYGYGDAESDLDSLWRTGYIALGFAAVCILTDYLILRKKNTE